MAFEAISVEKKGGVQDLNGENSTTKRGGCQFK
jgi:hypothetical protein